MKMITTKQNLGASFYIKKSNMKGIYTFSNFNFVNETIKAEDAHRDLESVQSVIDGKRDMCFLVITGQKFIDPRNSISALGNAINHGLSLIPIRSRKEGVAFLIYRSDKKKAEKFSKFIEAKEGYLNDKTPDEARFIGNMLEYELDDIEAYIKKRYMDV